MAGARSLISAVRHPGRVRRLQTMVSCGVLALLAGTGTAAGHGTFVDVRPLPGVTVGGTVDEVAFLFPEDIVLAGATIRVTAADGSEVRATGDLVSPVPTVARQPIRPLVDPGEYLVRYSIPSFDGTVFEGSFAFGYDPEAPPLEPLPYGRRPAAPLPAIAGVALALVVVGRGLWVWRSSRRGRVASSSTR